MDKISKYKAIISDVLETRAKNMLANSPGAQSHLVYDGEKNEYVLIWVGWSGSSYTHGLMFHIQIIDEKVWVHEDRTDIGIADVLVEAGIPKTDIVLGFVAPYARSISGFAAA
jgi:hypothetical protein